MCVCELGTRVCVCELGTRVCVCVCVCELGTRVCVCELGTRVCVCALAPHDEKTFLGRPRLLHTVRGPEPFTVAMVIAGASRRRNAPSRSGCSSSCCDSSVGPAPFTFLRAPAPFTFLGSPASFTQSRRSRAFQTIFFVGAFGLT